MRKMTSRSSTLFSATAAFMLPSYALASSDATTSPLEAGTPSAIRPARKATTYEEACGEVLGIRVAPPQCKKTLGASGSSNGAEPSAAGDGGMQTTTIALANEAPSEACIDRPVMTPENSQQLYAHCSAARVAQEGINANKGLNTMWFAAAGICGVCAATSFVPPTACYVGAGGAAINEVMKTKDLGGLFGALTANMSMLAPAMMLMNSGGGGGNQTSSTGATATSGATASSKATASSGGVAGSRATASVNGVAKSNAGGVPSGGNGRPNPNQTGTYSGTEGSGEAGKPATASPGQPPAANIAKAGGGKGKSCMGLAIYSAMQAMAKKKNMGDLQNTYDSSLAQALALYNTQASTPGVDPFSETPPQPTVFTNNRSGNPFVSGSGSGTGSGSGGTSAGTDGGTSASDACAGGTSVAVQTCAMANDKNLPDFMKDREFGSNSEKYLGANLADLFKNNLKGYGANELSQALGGGGSNAGQIAQELKTLEGKIASGETKLEDAAEDAAYSRGGGAGAGESAAPSAEDPLGAALAAMMAQMSGAKPGDAASGAKELDFAAKIQNRSPASIAEDPRISIFDRITYRYGVAGKRIFGSSPSATR